MKKMNNIKRLFTSTAVKMASNPDKILEAIEQLLNKQKELASDIQNKEIKSNILKEVLSYKKRKYEEAVTMREYMEKNAFKYVTLDDNLKAKINTMNNEYNTMMKLYHEKLDKLNKNEFQTVWELFKVEKSIVNTTRKRHIANEKILDEAFQEKVSQGLVSQEEQALYAIMRLKRQKERADFCKLEDAFMDEASKSPIDYVVESMDTDMPSMDSDE
jgi:rubrerythrin